MRARCAALLLEWLVVFCFDVYVKLK